VIPEPIIFVSRGITVLTPAWAGIVQSVQRLATGWTVRGPNPNEDEDFRTRPDWLWGPPSLLYNIYRAFSREIWSRRGVDHPPHITPEMIKEPTCTSISLLGLRGYSELYLTYTSTAPYSALLCLVYCAKTFLIPLYITLRSTERS
jgi:hypothetical protein